jgi:general secretion pathway protein I
MRHAGRAFTLIEVMVALAIVAITLGAGLRAAGALTDNAQRLGDVSIAQWCADNQLAGLKLAHQYPDVGDGDFTCVEFDQTYPGKLSVRPTPNPNFRRVDAQVFDPAGRPLVTISTVLGRF